MYLIKTAWWLRSLYPSFVWKIDTDEKVLYLTFDDGPHETATPFVLDELKKYNAKATFFCIGNNVVQHRNIYERILAEGHAVGNHTFHHLNGWKTKDEDYINDINQAAKEIDSNLFRPPYGRIKRSQWSKLNGQTKQEPFTFHHSPFTVIMWDVLSGDFDTDIQPQKCLANVLYHSKKGGIIVFHDSNKAWDRMSYALPRVLEHFTGEGYQFKALAVI